MTALRPSSIAMDISRHLLSVAACVVATSCANAPPLGLTQDVLLQTEPAGAACSIAQDGVVVASVEATPGTATVLRKKAPLEVACRKEGYVEARMTFAAARAQDVDVEEGVLREKTAGDIAGTFVTQGLVALVPPAAIGLAVGGAIAYSEGSPPYGFHRLPRFLLVPSTFDTDLACDAYFASLRSRLEAEADAQRSRINEQCQPWKQPRPSCETQLARVDAQLKAQLDQLPALRGHVRISSP